MEEELNRKASQVKAPLFWSSFFTFYSQKERDESLEEYNGEKIQIYVYQTNLAICKPLRIPPNANTIF
jgi:hypothetical protein